MTALGKVIVTVQNQKGTVFAGVGYIGWKRHFDWNEMQIIREEKSERSYPGGHSNGIVLEGKRRLKFGTMLNEERRYFVVQSLKYKKWY
jgi:hypothetical protein